MSIPTPVPCHPMPVRYNHGALSHATTYRGVVLALLFFATTINYLDRIVLAVMIPVIRGGIDFAGAVGARFRFLARHAGLGRGGQFPVGHQGGRGMVSPEGPRVRNGSIQRRHECSRHDRTAGAGGAECRVWMAH